LIFGDAIHKGLEFYYKDERSVNTAIDAFKSRWDEEYDALYDVYGGLFQMGIEEEWEIYQDKGERMLTYYDRYDREFPFWDEVLQINIEERSFIQILDPTGRHPKGNPLLSGRIDLVVRRKDGIWIVDHKTAANAYDARALDVDDQLTGYCYIYWRLTGEIPRGAIYNSLIKEPPGPPRVLKDGSLSKDKAQRTTYDLYLDAIRENNLAVDAYTDILEYLQGKGWHQFFVRDTVQRNIEELESFEERLYEEYRDMEDAIRHAERRYPNPSQLTCPFCPIVPICQALEEKGDIQYLIDEMYEVREPRVMIPEGV
jgi:hypothetical protein